jgi:hypothetical protein
MDPAGAKTFLQMASWHNLAVMGWAAAYFQGQPMPGADGYLDPATADHLRKLARDADANRMKVYLMDVAVQTRGHPELVQAESAVPVTGQVGRKNLIPNPSFEESTLPGWPDYTFARLRASAWTISSAIPMRVSARIRPPRSTARMP